MDGSRGPLGGATAVDCPQIAKAAVASVMKTKFCNAGSRIAHSRAPSAHWQCLKPRVPLAGLPSVLPDPHTACGNAGVEASATRPHKEIDDK